MKNFLIGLFAGIVLSVLTVFIVLFVVVRVAASFSERPTTVADGSTLIFDLEGGIPEKPPTEIPLPIFEGQTPITVAQVWETFRKAAADSRVKGIIFEPHELSIGWAKLQEIRQEIVEFKKSGKPIITFLRGPGTREYYLASATDRIFMMPEDMLDIKGLRVEAFYLKNTLDKLGVKMDVIHAGKYKDAGDIFTQTSMSPETAEVLNDVLDQFYGNLIDTIAQGRKKAPEEIRAIVDRGPFMGKQAQSNGLVDTLGYEDQAAQEMQRRLKQSKLTRLSSKAYLRVSASSVGAAGTRRIALVVGQGEITRGSADETVNEQGIVSGAFIKLLRQVENDSTIKGAIIRVDSPGGDGVASDEILQKVKDLGTKKPVVISMGDVAASGGYFISMTGDPVLAYPNTLTGSIGVIFVKPNLHGLYDKIGVTKQLLTRGHYAALDSDYKPLTDDELQKLRQEIDGFYRVFVSRVAQGRKRPYEDIEPLAQGRVWLGAEAKKNGLVDQLGGLDRAIELVKERAKIPASEKIVLVPYPPKRSLLDLLMSRSDDTPGIEMKAMRRLFGDLPVRAWARGGFLKLMPYTISVR